MSHGTKVHPNACCSLTGAGMRNAQPSAWGASSSRNTLGPVVGWVIHWQSLNNTLPNGQVMSGSLLSLRFSIMVSLFCVQKTSDTMIQASSEARYRANGKLYLFWGEGLLWKKIVDWKVGEFEFGSSYLSRSEGLIHSLQTSFFVCLFGPQQKESWIRHLKILLFLNNYSWIN